MPRELKKVEFLMMKTCDITMFPRRISGSDEIKTRLFQLERQVSSITPRKIAAITAGFRQKVLAVEEKMEKEHALRLKAVKKPLEKSVEEEVGKHIPTLAAAVQEYMTKRGGRGIATPVLKQADVFLKFQKMPASAQDAYLACSSRCLANLNALYNLNLISKQEFRDYVHRFRQRLGDHWFPVIHSVEPGVQRHIYKVL